MTTPKDCLSGHLDLDFGELDFYFVTTFCGLVDTVDDCLVVENLGSGDGCGTAGLDSVEEGTDLSLEETALAVILKDRNNGFGLSTAYIVVKNHGTANGAVPAVSGRNAESTFGTEDDGVTGSVNVHSPCNSEVEDDAAFETDERCCEIVNGETSCICTVVLGILAEEIGNITGYGQRLMDFITGTFSSKVFVKYNITG